MENLFHPDSGQARMNKERMYRKLFGSLRHIAEMASGQIGFDRSRLDKSIETMAASKLVSPNVFGIYNDILLAISNQDAAQLEALLNALTVAGLGYEDIVISAYQDGSFAPAKGERYTRYFNADSSSPVLLMTPSSEAEERIRSIADEAFDIIEKNCPELGSEISELISELVLCSTDDSDEGDFGSVSCFMLWGAMILNIDIIEDPLQFVESVAHESGHVKLFAYSTEEPLVHNPPQELYSSPLRADPRPMDGIFHATYVLARMHWTAREIYQSGNVDGSTQKRLVQNMEYYRNGFDGGMDAINTHAELSTIGNKLINDAAQYMSSESGIS